MMTGPTGPALYARFLRGLAVAADRPAVRIAEDTLSYRAAHEQALLWAGSVLAGSEPRVIGVLAGKGFTAYTAVLAGLYAGATVVPLHPDFPAVRTRRMLQLAGVSALIVDAAGHAALPEVFGADLDIPVLAPGLRAADRRYRAIPLDPRHALAAPRPVAADDIAYMLFTSGSTGNPKGVPITHGNTDHYFRLLDDRYDFTPGDIFSQTFDLNFDCAMFDLFCAWGAGASVAVIPPQAYRDMPSYLAERRLTVWFSTPSSIGLLRRMGALSPGSMPGLRWSFFAGEALTCADAADWQLAAPNSAVENLYGPTELTVTITGHRWSAVTSPPLSANGIVPIGAVHPGHDHLLIGADGEPTDEEGELVITGPQMTAGYLDPADDEGRFLHRDGRSWYRTGDRVRRHPGGELAYLGRLDSQVQVQGWRVELAEIDHALRACTGVDDGVVVVREVDGVTELVAFYTGEQTTAVALSRQLRRRLPDRMVPRHYHRLAEFPLNSNRKVDRKKLRGHAQELAVAPAKAS
jgi:amino acid adenylation domain-containing protein